MVFTQCNYCLLILVGQCWHLLTSGSKYNRRPLLSLNQGLLASSSHSTRDCWRPPLTSLNQGLLASSLLTCARETYLDVHVNTCTKLYMYVSYHTACVYMINFALSSPNTVILSTYYMYILPNNFIALSASNVDK